MPYYTTTQKTGRGGAAEPVLPLGVINWSGILMEDGRYLIWARATVDLTLFPLISIVTRESAAALTERATEDDLSLWTAAA